ncbi:hypothetical protein [Micromonospora globbae]|uniref:Uncharacterized protein n=1 Tax=Micromonospora globbae TaxID=1894969 RepID=A0A420F2X6_9ACTN|nr:hypothetical protein [Micromonospora globbae]RKF27333.1 hypothetical protein D7I43_09665 [Micromonospora globbae]WTF86577.1 hypothetical protein OH732_02915 [Micromonospora globbae]
MTRPRNPGGGNGDGGNPRPDGDGDGDTGTPSGRRPGTSKVPDNISQAHDELAKTAERGRPEEEGQQPTKQPDSDSTTSDGETPDAFVDSIVSDPKSVAGRSAEDIAQQFNDAGYPATVQQSTKKGTSGNAVQVRIQGHPEITNIQVHPGGGRHTPEGSPYWKISTSTAGKIWVIPEDFRGADDLNGNVVRYDE